MQIPESHVHAVLTRQSDGSYTVLDPGSTNGTFLNNMDEPIRQLVPVALRAGDCIYLGAWTGSSFERTDGSHGLRALGGEGVLVTVRTGSLRHRARADSAPFLPI